MQLDDAIQKRQSIRSYSSKKVDFALITEILEAGRQAPAAGNISTIKFVVVEKPELREKLAEAAGQQFISQAPWIIVVCSATEQTTRSYEERAEMYSRQQAGAAIENMLLKITALGLASCWIGAFDDDAVKAILHIPDNVDVEALLPVAYPASIPLKRKRQELKLMTYFEQYGQTQKRPAFKPEAK